MLQKFYRKEATREKSGFGYTEFNEAIKDKRFPPPDGYLGPRSPFWTETTIQNWQAEQLANKPYVAAPFRDQCRAAGLRSAQSRAAKRDSAAA